MVVVQNLRPFLSAYVLIFTTKHNATRFFQLQANFQSTACAKHNYLKQNFFNDQTLRIEEHRKKIIRPAKQRLE